MEHWHCYSKIKKPAMGARGKMRAINRQQSFSRVLLSQGAFSPSVATIIQLHGKVLQKEHSSKLC